MQRYQKVKAMIQMDKKQDILHLYRVEGMSLRGISRKTHLGRKTVTKWVREYEAAIVRDPENGLCDYLAEVPKSKPHKGKVTILTPEVCGIIDGWLVENTRRRQTGLKKQCLNRWDIWQDLHERGFSISYSSICKYIAKRKNEKSAKSKEAFIKQYYEPGEECEFDWGEVKLRIDDKPVTFTMAVFALCHSEGRWAYLFRHQDALAFMESHRNFFKDIHGVPRTMVYDNMRVAVAFTDNGKKPTDTLQRLYNYYRYDYRFCNARAGWEKGHVERSVDYVRGQAFKRKIDFGCIEEAQQWLDATCTRLNGETGSISTANKQTALAEDLQALQPYPGEFGCFLLEDYIVDKQSTICVKKNHYSVPDYLVGHHVMVQVYSEKLRIFDAQHALVATHERSYTTGSWTLDINHYISTLSKKPGAIDGSLAMRQLPKAMQELYRVHFRQTPKDFLSLLKYSKEHQYGYDDILSAVQTIRSRGARHITYDQIKVALEMKDALPVTYREEQQTDQFIEISLGSEDVLAQCEGLMNQTQCIHSGQEGGAL